MYYFIPAAVFRCGNEYAVFFLFLPSLSLHSCFLPWDLLPSFGSNVQFLNVVGWCNLSTSNIPYVSVLLDIHLKFSWSHFCTLSFFAVFSDIVVFLTKLLFDFFTFFQRKTSPMLTCFLPPPPSTLSLFPTHRRRWENVMLTWLLVGELGL